MPVPPDPKIIIFNTSCCIPVIKLIFAADEKENCHFCFG